MSARFPRHKGTGLLPIVKALSSSARGQAAVPERLRHYLHGEIVASEWYPEDDYHALLGILAELATRDGMSDVWTLFGTTGAQRDLAGDQGLVREELRVESAGVYRRFVGSEATSVASLFRRLVSLWSAYHDSGRMIALASELDDCTVCVRLLDFKFPVRGMAKLQAAYACEFARLVGIQMSGQVTHTTAAGDAFDEWEYSVARSPEAIRSIAELPRRQR
jgi:hypothetical protein